MNKEFKDNIIIKHKLLKQIQLKIFSKSDINKIRKISKLIIKKEIYFCIIEFCSTSVKIYIFTYENKKIKIVVRALKIKFEWKWSNEEIKKYIENKISEICKQSEILISGFISRGFEEINNKLIFLKAKEIIYSISNINCCVTSESESLLELYSAISGFEKEISTKMIFFFMGGISIQIAVINFPTIKTFQIIINKYKSYSIFKILKDYIKKNGFNDYILILGSNFGFINNCVIKNTIIGKPIFKEYEFKKLITGFLESKELFSKIKCKNDKKIKFGTNSINSFSFAHKVIEEFGFNAKKIISGKDLILKKKLFLIGSASGLATLLNDILIDFDCK